MELCMENSRDHLKSGGRKPACHFASGQMKVWMGPWMDDSKDHWMENLMGHPKEEEMVHPVENWMVEKMENVKETLSVP